MIEIGRMGGRRSAERRRLHAQANAPQPGETQNSPETAEAKRSDAM
jgi:hypothetical protein